MSELMDTIVVLVMVLFYCGTGFVQLFVDRLDNAQVEAARNGFLLLAILWMVM